LGFKRNLHVRHWSSNRSNLEVSVYALHPSHPPRLLFRLAILADIRHHFKSRELKKPLKTAEKKVALGSALQLAASAFNLFERLRDMAKFPYSPVFTVNGFKQLPDGSISFDSVQTRIVDNGLQLPQFSASAWCSTSRNCRNHHLCRIEGEEVLCSCLGTFCIVDRRIPRSGGADVI
jgi:hypothetical protein